MHRPDTRPRLLYVIERFQAKRVTEIKARPEFGKTSLAVAWAERLQKCGKQSPGSASMLTTMNQQAHIENLVIRVDQEPEPYSSETAQSLHHLAVEVPVRMCEDW